MRVALQLRELACCFGLLGVLGCGRIGYELDPGRVGGRDTGAAGDLVVPPTDAGPPTDGAPPADTALLGDMATPSDVGPPTDMTPAADGRPPDSGTDMALPPDTGPPVDTAPPMDTAPPADAAPPADTAPPVDTAPPAGSFTFSGQTETAREGWTTSGTPYQDLCPAGQVVIGYQGFQANSPTMPWLRSVQTQCGALLLGPGPGYAVTTATGAALPDRGHASGTSWIRLCPTNQVVVGFSGRSSGYVDALSFRCAPVMVSGFQVSVGAITSTPQTDSEAGQPFAPIDCPAGKLAVGSNITADSYPRSFGLICATPSPR